MKKIFIYTLLIIIAAVVVCSSVYFYYVNSVVSENTDDSSFTIVKGEGVKQISRNLYDKKIIRSRLLFEIYIWLQKKEAEFQAGKYELPSGLDIKAVTAILTSGQAINPENTIKIIEGWKAVDINAYLKKQGLLADDSFVELAGSKIVDWPFTREKYSFLADAPAAADYEGFLFPDTYRVFKDARAEDIILKLLDNFDKKLAEQTRADIKNQGRTIFEVVTLASLIEKEVKEPEDMKIVSGIFLNRIKSGQPLESCATLAYILGINKAQYTKEDTQIISPYNTYSHQGLPPGPIANPGLAALLAAVYPAKTEFNYFLSCSDNGATIFSRTYEEHLRNKNKYLK